MPVENCPARGEWTRLLHEALTDDRQRQLEAHLERCPECRKQLDEIAGALPLCPEPVAAEGGGATLLESVMRKLLSPAAPAESTGGAGTPELLELPPGMLEPATRRGSLGRIGHFDVLSVIGRGGLGVVLRAFDPKLNRIVAIKIPAPELVANPMVRRRFQREAQAAAAVTNEHVVRIYAVDEARSIPFLVMEYVDGCSLQQEIDRRGALDVKQVVRVGMQLAQGLAAAHKQGLVHRDIKPANILLDGGLERVKLTDFGLARAIDDATLTQSGTVAGTPQYMSPEQARGETVDSRSDLFSLGGVLYTMCTGRPAFRAETPLAVLRRICDDEPRPLRQINSEIPSWLAEIVETLLRKNPEERYQTAEEVGSALESWLAHLQQPQLATPIETFVTEPAPRRVAEPVAGRSVQPHGRAFWVAVSFGAVLALMLLLGFIVAIPTRVDVSGPQGFEEPATARAPVDVRSALVAPPVPPVPVVDPLAEEGVFRLPGQVNSVVFSRDGESLLAGTWGFGVMRIALPRSTVRRTPQVEGIPRAEILSQPDPAESMTTLFADGPKHVIRLAALPDGRIAIGGEEGVFQLRNLKNPQSVQ
ncbi:MAG: serine/threonine protein kinase, partial [Planctomycetaceae bacterium]